MDEKQRTYISIDLKSFYASVECVERGLDPLDTNLVVADIERTEKTICLAVTPSLKSYGISGRARLFEVISKVKSINADRKRRNDYKEFESESYFYHELNNDRTKAVTYITATPRMALYMDYSSRIYSIYLRYIAPEDMHVYSIDEVFMDVTDYLNTYKVSARELAKRIIRDIISETGITATAGIGTNLYLCKIAMDIFAKKMKPDEDGMRIGYLNEEIYRRELWNHRPITDFWRVGRGTATKLANKGLYTMGDIARCSEGEEKDFFNEDLLYDMFGVNAELLIDHAWGYEPCKISDIKSYEPEKKSMCSGQVLKEPYTYEKTRLVVAEMAELLALDMSEKHMVTDKMVLTVGYDVENIKRSDIGETYKGQIVTDWYGRKIPQHARGTYTLSSHTSSQREIREGVVKLFDNIINKKLLCRRINLTAENIIAESKIEKFNKQLSVFDYIEDNKKSEKEREIQKTILSLRERFGKNAVAKGMNLEEGATAIERNKEIGGHRA